MEFISCNSKKSKPKVHVTVCSACKRRRTCDDYSRYREPLLFPQLNISGGAKKVRNRRLYAKPSEPIRKQEQLRMGKLFGKA